MANNHKSKNETTSQSNAISRIVSCCASSKICSDFDKDCKEVGDPVNCWLGGKNITRNGIPVFVERADGYCPFAQHCN